MAARAMWKSVSNFRKCSFLTRRKLLPFRYSSGGQAVLSTAAKPYAFHPKTRTLEAENQALYLTKTILKEGLPVSVRSNSFEDSLRDQLMNRFRQCIIQTRLFNYEEERSTKTTCALPLMVNMLKVVWSEGKRLGINLLYCHCCVFEC
jgi:hypothetical protein